MDPLKSRAAKKRLLFAPLILVVLAAGSGAYWIYADDERGREAVAQMCAADGGPRVLATSYAPGYLDAAHTTSTCIACAEMVGRGVFDFVDWVAPAASEYIKEPGYQRMSIGNAGDPRCEPYLGFRTRHREYAVKVPADYGRSEDQCLAIEHLREPPTAGFTYSVRFERVRAENGYWLGMFEQAIAEMGTGRVLATNRDYIYTAFLTQHLDMGGRGGKTDATCPSAQVWKFSSDKMLQTVLRDETKKEDAAK